MYSRTDQKMIIWHTRFACWVTKATNTHSEYVILIAFPLQQWLHESTSLLTLYVHCLLVRSLFTWSFRLFTSYKFNSKLNLNSNNTAVMSSCLLLDNDLTNYTCLKICHSVELVRSHLNIS